MRDRGNAEVRIGVDIVEIGRVERLLEENPDILEILFTAREIEYCEKKRDFHAHLALRFAAKEAVLKAFGTGLGSRMRWTDVEIVNQLDGKPAVLLHNEVADWARRRGLQQGENSLDISLSRTRSLAVAEVVTAWQ